MANTAPRYSGHRRFRGRKSIARGGMTDDTTEGYVQRQRPSGCWRSEFRSNAPDTPGQGRSHLYVPRKLDLGAQSPDCDDVTTVMIRNVPNGYDRALLMQEMDELGLANMYDFLYLPADSATGWTVGYAFANFERPEHAQLCISVMQGHDFLRFRKGKPRVAQVAVAHIQGLENNLKHCNANSVFNAPRPGHRPWVREQQERQGKAGLQEPPPPPASSCAGRCGGPSGHGHSVGHAGPPAGAPELEVRSEPPCPGRLRSLPLLERRAPGASPQDSDALSTADSLVTFHPDSQETRAVDSSPTSEWSSESLPCATTLTLLNVPLHYTEDMLKWTLQSRGLLFRCNFVYLPRVQAVGDALARNMGHALLNFLTPDDAALARALLAGLVWDSRVGHDGKQIVAEVVDAMPHDYQACVNYINLITTEQTSCASLLDWLDVPALNPGSPAWRDY